MNIDTLETSLTIIALMAVLISFIKIKIDSDKQQNEIDKLDKRFEHVIKSIL